jgi:hypothetical protein
MVPLRTIDRAKALAIQPTLYKSNRAAKERLRARKILRLGDVNANNPFTSIEHVQKLE